MVDIGGLNVILRKPPQREVFKLKQTMAIFSDASYHVFIQYVLEFRFRERDR